MTGKGRSYEICFVVVDGVEAATKCAELSNRLATDPRIPGAKIFLALPANRQVAGDLEQNVNIIDESFGPADIERYIDRFKDLLEY